MAAIIGRRLIARRWSKHPVACGWVAWGLGLTIAVALARASVYSARTWFLEVISTAVRSFYGIDPAAWVFVLIGAFSLWVVIQGVLILLEPSEAPEVELSPDEVRSLLPLYRVRIRRGRINVLVVEEGRIVSYLLNASRHADGFLLDENVDRFDEGIAFHPHPTDSTEGPELQVVAERFGLVGPRKAWKVRLSQSGKTRTFQIPPEDYPNLRDALKLVAGAAFVEKGVPRRSWMEWLFLSLSAALVALNLWLKPSPYPVMIASQADSEITGVARVIAWLGPLLVLFGYLAWGREGLGPKVARNRRATKPAKERKPWNSAALGWSLKLASVAYAVFMLGSPTVERWVERREADRPVTAVLNSVWAGLMIPAALLMFVGHRLTRKPFVAGMHGDARPPFLYLRAFDDDNRRTLQPTTALGRFLGVCPEFVTKRKAFSASQMAHVFIPVRWIRMLLGNPCESVEELLALGVGGVGPLVAIGRPHERVITSGADRMYVSDDRWQAVVLNYLKESAGVILQPSLTDGVIWEIDRTMEITPRDRILLSMVNYQDRPNDYERLRLHLMKRHRLSLPRMVPHLGRPCFVQLGSGGVSRLLPVVYQPTILWPVLGNAIDIKATLDPYLAEASVEMPTPRMALERPGFFGVVTSIGLNFALAIGLSQGIRLVGHLFLP